MLLNFMSPLFFLTSSMNAMKTPSPALLIYERSRQFTTMLKREFFIRFCNASSSFGAVCASRYPLSSRTFTPSDSRCPILKSLIDGPPMTDNSRRNPFRGHPPLQHHKRQVVVCDLAIHECLDGLHNFFLDSRGRPVARPPGDFQQPVVPKLFLSLPGFRDSVCVEYTQIPFMQRKRVLFDRTAENLSFA